MTSKKKSRVGQDMIDGLRELVETYETYETYESGGMPAIRREFRTTRAKLALAPSTYTSEEVRETRDLIGLSQSRFAAFLGVSPKTV